MFFLIHFLSAVCVCLTCVFILLVGSLGSRQFWRGTIYWSFLLSIIFLMSNWKILCLTVDPKYFLFFQKYVSFIFLYFKSVIHHDNLFTTMKLRLRLIGGLTDLPLNGILPLTKLLFLLCLSVGLFIWVCFLSLFYQFMCVSHLQTTNTTLFWFM